MWSIARSKQQQMEAEEEWQHGSRCKLAGKGHFWIPEAGNAINLQAVSNRYMPARKREREREWEGSRVEVCLTEREREDVCTSATSFRKHPPLAMIDCSSFFILNENAPCWQELVSLWLGSRLVGWLLGSQRNTAEYIERKMSVQADCTSVCLAGWLWHTPEPAQCLTARRCRSCDYRASDVGQGETALRHAKLGQIPPWPPTGIKMAASCESLGRWRPYPWPAACLPACQSTVNCSVPVSCYASSSGSY